MNVNEKNVSIKTPNISTPVVVAKEPEQENNANNNLLHHPPLQQRQMHSQSAQQHQPLNTNQNMLISRPVLMNNKNIKSMAEDPEPSYFLNFLTSNFMFLCFS